MGSLKDRVAQAEAAAAAPTAGLAPIFGSDTTPGRRLMKIPLALIDPWSDAKNDHQPFRLYSEADMADMMETLEAHGTCQPILVRPRNGRYQLLAGHNRTVAAGRLGWLDIDAIVRFDLEDDDDEAANIMIITNVIQREGTLPSEKAKAFRILLDQNNHQGKAGDGPRTDALVAAQKKLGRSTIQRYARLTALCDELLDIVDGFQWDPKDPTKWVLIPEKRRIPLTVAEKLVTLNLADQGHIVDLFRRGAIKSISAAQAAELSAARQLTPTVEDIPTELIDRCFGLSDSNDPDATASSVKPLVLKLDGTFLRGFAPDAAKYIKEEDCLALIIRTIGDYITQREAAER